MIRTTPVNGYVGCAAALANHDVRSAIGSVTRPVLLMVGEKDGATTAEMRRMRLELPGARLVELPGAGHISNLDQPATFTQALAQFLAG